VLRVDLHRLFDRGLLIILPTYEVVWHPDLQADPAYGELTGITRLLLPESGNGPGLPERSALACKATNSVARILLGKRTVLHAWARCQLERIRDCRELWSANQP